jgi:hypothetical protein
MNEQLVKRICTARTLMERVAEKYEYNLVHPTVVSVSQRLDRLIVSYMKKCG